MNKIKRIVMNIALKRQMKKLNIPFGKGEDVVARTEAVINQMRQAREESNKGRFDELLSELPFEGYEVLATCDTCHEVDIVGCAPTLEEALAHAKEGCGMTMDDENVMHHYRTAVIKMNRELIYTPQQVSYEKDLDNK